jgi:tetratricopeptide (TPR) repeat protein
VEADRVAEAVGDLPLAVEQAGTLLADTGLAVDRYLRLLTERAKDVLDHDPGGAYPRSLAASWAVAFDRLAAVDPTALDLLTVVAWCGPEPVPLTLLTDHPDPLPNRLRPLATDPLLLARCTTILHRRGMATISPHGIQLHRVPAALLRARSQASEGTASALWAATVVRLLEKAAPSNLRTDPSGLPLWKPLLPHVLAAAGRDVALAAVPAEATRLLDLAAGYLLGGGGEIKAAAAVYQRAYDVRRATFGDDHPDTLTSASDLAGSLWWLGEYQRSRALDEDALARRRRILGEDHPDTLTSAGQLANDLYGLGDYRQARELQEATLRRRRRMLGADHPDTLFSANLLSLDLWALGDFRRARQLQNDTVIRLRRILGDDHPDTLASAGLLGAVVWSLGDYRRARQLLNDTLTRSRGVLGDDHWATLLSASHLGMVLWSLGDYQQARRSRQTPSLASAASWARTTSSPCAQPACSASPCDLWASTRRPVTSRTTPSPASAVCWARTTPKPCRRSAYSASPWDLWASTGRPATSRPTPLSASAGCWATATPLPSLRPAGSRPICASWANISRPAPSTRTPWHGVAACWARTTPTPSPRATTLPPT